jgi:8-oxo-dGTP diphosphatase
MQKKQIEVVGAVIIRDGSIFCAQRGPDGNLPGMWEFPGGKVEQDESHRDALEREIREELNCRVRVGAEVASTRHTYEFGNVSLTTYYCELVDAEPTLSEHQSAVWLLPSELHSVDWAPADLPAVNIVQQELASQ